MGLGPLARGGQAPPFFTPRLPAPPFPGENSWGLGKPTWGGKAWAWVPAPPLYSAPCFSGVRSWSPSASQRLSSPIWKGPYKPSQRPAEEHGLLRPARHPAGRCALLPFCPGSRVRAPPQEGFPQLFSAHPLWHCLALPVAAEPAPRATPVWLRPPPLTGSLGLKWYLYLQPLGQPLILSQPPK